MQPRYRLCALPSKLRPWRTPGYPADMSKPTTPRPRKSSGRARGAALAAKQAPKVCKVELSSCMKGGGRRKAGPCMRAFHACKKGR